MDRRVLPRRGLSTAHHATVPKRQLMKRLIAVVFALSLLVFGTALRALARPAPGSTVVERNITNSSDFRSGEPEIAVDPTNPANIVFVATAIRYYRVDEGGNQVTLPWMLNRSGNQTTNSSCFIFYTNDGGTHWHQVAWPLSDPPTAPNCGDPMVAVDRYGTFYYAADWGSGVTVVYSTDGGADWSQPVLTGTGEDRPFLRVDRSSGKVYMQSGSSGRLMAFASGVPHDCLAHDGRPACKLTFSTPVVWPGNHIAVANGIVALAAQTSLSDDGTEALANSTQLTTQLTFEYSNDDWKHVTTEAVTDSNGNPVIGGAGDFITADPNRTNRFAVMQQTGTTYQIYVTNDLGHHWSGPTVIDPAGIPYTGDVLTNGNQVYGDASPNIPWIDYSVDQPGVIGLLYKETDTHGNLDVWSMVSFNNGASFSKPLQLNARSASPAESTTEGWGDDVSWVLIANKTVYGGYGQMAPCTVIGTASSCLNGFLAKAPLTAYRPLGTKG